MYHSDVSLSFRTLQTVSDLRSVVATGFSDLAQALETRHKSALRRVIFDQHCRFSAADCDQVCRPLTVLAASPEGGCETFLTATALLLADQLQASTCSTDVKRLWNSFQDDYRDGPAPVRAAVMNGFSRVQNSGSGEELRVHPGDLITYDIEDLQRLLRRIVRAMDDNIRDAICRTADAGTAEVHRRALDNCIAGSCVLSEFGGWFPGEVVEKVSLDPAHNGFAGCTALVLLNAIVTRDAMGKMAFRWEEYAARYVQMPAAFRDPIVAGCRHLHEMSFDWHPYRSWTADRLVEKAVVIPFAKP